MTTDAEYDVLELSEYRRRPGPDHVREQEPPRIKCPRCLRGMYHPSLLRKIPGTDGPYICGACINWEQRWMQVEREREDARLHGQTEREAR
jgi:hypothetical protein